MINKKLREQFLSAIRGEYDRLDILTGINSKDVIIEISGRLSRKLGYFSVQKKNILSKPVLKIIISEKILSDEKLFIDTIRHEYAHMYVYKKHPFEKHGHDAVWKAACRLVGARPRATVKIDHTVSLMETKPYKFEIVCKVCGSVSRYKTESKAVKIAGGKEFGRLYCKKCEKSRFLVRKL